MILFECPYKNEFCGTCYHSTPHEFVSVCKSEHCRKNARVSNLNCACINLRKKKLLKLKNI